jgi:hypothetical protein
MISACMIGYASLVASRSPVPGHVCPDELNTLPGGEPASGDRPEGRSWKPRRKEMRKPRAVRSPSIAPMRKSGSTAGPLAAATDRTPRRGLRIGSIREVGAATNQVVGYV